jgi:hypothetical protein
MLTGDLHSNWWCTQWQRMFFDIIIHVFDQLGFGFSFDVAHQTSSFGRNLQRKKDVNIEKRKKKETEQQNLHPHREASLENNSAPSGCCPF